MKVYGVPGIATLVPNGPINGQHQYQAAIILALNYQAMNILPIIKVGIAS